MSDECSAVVRLPNGSAACANGFYLTGPCLGTSGTPMCLKEEVCGRLFNSCGGKPPTLSEQEAHRHVLTTSEKQEPVER